VIPFEALISPTGAVFEPGEEQLFKLWHMEGVARRIGPAATAFQIENEEKEPGFPDVLIDIQERAPLYIEYKVSDKKGMIEFQKTQPLFYKRHPQMPIYVVAYSVPDGEYYVFIALHVVQAMMISERKNPLKVSVKGGRLL